MKYWFLLTLLVLVSCSRTETVYFPSEQRTQQVIELNTSAPEVPEITQPLETSVPIQNTRSTRTNERADAETSSQSTVQTTTEESSVATAEDYKITSCCDDGLLFAQATELRNFYSVNDVKDLLIRIYHDNCASFKDKTVHRIYLRFKGDIQDSGYLTYFKFVNYKRIVVDFITSKEDFEVCT